jgi:hypothetical protein
VPIVLKSGSLSLLEHSGPVQACNGIALPLPFTVSCTRRMAPNKAVTAGPEDATEIFGRKDGRIQLNNKVLYRNNWCSSFSQLSYLTQSNIDLFIYIFTVSLSDLTFSTFCWGSDKGKVKRVGGVSSSQTISKRYRF